MHGPEDMSDWWFKRQTLVLTEVELEKRVTCMMEVMFVVLLAMVSFMNVVVKGILASAVV
jgi:hypothetical protein